MNNLSQIAKKVGQVIMLGLVFFILQGCTKPFVSVDVAVDGCCKDGECGAERDIVAGCNNPPAVPSGGGLYDQPDSPIQCMTGNFCGNLEHDICGRGKRCDTQYTPGSSTNCTCACVKNPD